MNKDGRNLTVDVCDYSKKVLCNLYDSSANIDGQATDVFINTERNGFKELTFRLPSTCNGEDNYRLNFLINDYYLRTIGDNGIDWFTISEPKIAHNDFSKTTDVRANHISQALKTKGMSKEYSDSEGGNVGTCLQLITSVLEGTDWSVGEVAEFYEDEANFGEHVVKVRSLNAAAKTGVLKLVSMVCELFDAKPIYHGEGKLLDVVPINPFSEKLQTGHIPDEVLENKVHVLELHYDRSLKGITRTLNSENMVTKLYATGAYGTQATGATTLQNCEHTEITITLASANEQGTEILFANHTGSNRYFTLPKNYSAGAEFIYSDLDFVSRSYVWDGENPILVYEKPNSPIHPEIVQTSEKTLNYFPYVMDFSYYRNCGLLTDEMFKDLASFQRVAYLNHQTAYESSLIFSTEVGELTKTVGTNKFLKLNVIDIRNKTFDGETTKQLCLNESKTITYRSDYLSSPNKYFSWNVATRPFNDRGKPVSAVGSIVYVVHNTTPITYDKAYVRLISDEAEDFVEDGKPISYNYELDDRTPTRIALWNSKLTFTAGDRFYLFYSDSMSGGFGAKEIEVESEDESLNESTKQETVYHPTYFILLGDDMPSRSVAQASYGWTYVSNPNSTNFGDLYFCIGENDVWNRVYLGETAPANGNVYAYFYNTRKYTLHKWDASTSAWIWMDSAEEKRIANNFAVVIQSCKKREQLIKGYAEKYVRNSPNYQPGRYAIKNEFDYYWAFNADREISSKLWYDTTERKVWQQNEPEHFFLPETKDSGSVTLPIANQMEAITFVNGYVDYDGVINGDRTDYRRSYDIYLWENVRYKCNLPTGARITFYTSSQAFLGYAVPSAGGYVTAPANTNHCIICCSATPASNWTKVSTSDEPLDRWNLKASYYMQVDDYQNKIFLSNKEYTLIPCQPQGNRLGINYYVKKFCDTADDAYGIQLITLIEAQEAITDAEIVLANTLGDMYKEGWWQKTDYVEDDRQKLYNDTLDNLQQVAKPQPTYEINFLDLYETNNSMGFSIDGSTEMTEWPDIDTSMAVHLVDQDINVNCWAYIDKLKKCYDQRWRTKIEINTRLSMIGQQTFSDVLAKIAEIANETKAKQTIYDRAAALSSNGTLAAERLEGAINTYTTSILNGASNYHTDENGNFVFESADGTSAMMLGGRGLMISSSKDEWGNWKWRSAFTGQGMTADAIYAGYLSGVRIEAGTITADKLISGIGQELDIGSNAALNLYATASGSRPAGSLQTGVLTATGAYDPVGEDESYVQIKAAKKNAQGVITDEAAVNIASGGKVNILGGELNLESKGTMNIKSGSTLSIKSGSEFLVNSPNFKITKSGTTYSLEVAGKGTFQTGEIAGFTLSYYPTTSPTRRFLYANGCNSVTSTAAGVYIGTDGINVGGKLQFKADGTLLKISGDKFDIDAYDGTIAVKGSDSITVNAGQELKLITNTASGQNRGKITIGNAGQAFTIGSNGTNAYIYNRISSLTPATFGTATAGIYLGTDGINVGNTFKVNASDGTVQVKGSITSGSTISGATITGGTLGIGGTSNDNFKVDSSGNLASKGSITLKNGDTTVFSVSSSGASFYGSITSGSTITGATIKGGSIGIGNGTSYNNFVVDTDGNVTIKGGSITIKDSSQNTIFSASSNGVSIKGSIESGSTISAPVISGGSITSSSISSASISAGTISGAAISGGTISGGAISGGTVSGSTISGGTISGATISGNTITGGSISCQNVSISGTINVQAGSQISNWAVGNGYIWSGGGANCVCMAQPNANADGRFAFSAGSNSAATAGFSVYVDESGNCAVFAQHFYARHWDANTGWVYDWSV